MSKYGTYVLRDSLPAGHDGRTEERIFMVKDGEVKAIYTPKSDGFSLDYEPPGKETSIQSQTTD